MKKTFLALVVLVSGAAFAQAAASDKVTKAQRDEMAQVHEKFATCLRSDRPIADCHAEMAKSCQRSMGRSAPDLCPMMGRPRRGMGPPMMAPPMQEK